MKKVEKDTFVLNKLDKKLYKYVEYRESVFSHVLLCEKEEISFFATNEELLIDDDDIIVDFDEMIVFLTNSIKELEKTNKKYRKDIENPLDKGKGLSLKNTIVTEIYNIKRSLMRNSMTIEKEYALNNELKKKEDELHLLELRLKHTFFVDYAILEIEKNNKAIENCKNSLVFVKKEAKAKKERDKKRFMNDLVINLDKIIIGGVSYYKIAENDSFLDTNDLFSIVSYENEPIAVLVFSNMVDYGDYNYDDEYEPNYCEENSYKRIFYSPLTGKKIVFNIVSTVDETVRYEEMQNIVDKYSNRKRFSKEQKMEFARAKEILKQIDDGLLEVIYDVE